MPAAGHTLPIPPEAEDALTRALEAHAECEEQAERQEARRQAMADARAAGATQRAIAERLGVSESFVKLEVAKVRGAAWAK